MIFYGSSYHPTYHRDPRLFWAQLMEVELRDRSEDVASSVENIPKGVEVPVVSWETMVKFQPGTLNHVSQFLHSLLPQS